MHRKRLKQTLDRRIVTRCSPDTKKHILKDKKKQSLKKLKFLNVGMMMDLECRITKMVESFLMDFRWCKNMQLFNKSVRNQRLSTLYEAFVEFSCNQKNSTNSKHLIWPFDIWAAEHRPAIIKWQKLYSYRKYMSFTCILAHGALFMKMFQKKNI